MQGIHRHIGNLLRGYLNPYTFCLWACSLTLMGRNGSIYLDSVENPTSRPYILRVKTSNLRTVLKRPLLLVTSNLLIPSRSLSSWEFLPIRKRVSQRRLVTTMISTRILNTSMKSLEALSTIQR
uniref:Uncharacterized protein n=1 Tax=Cacopsylla melanoneura TaxID=428564 RepID=A0A8D8W963_9HEMI